MSHRTVIALSIFAALVSTVGAAAAEGAKKPAVCLQYSVTQDAAHNAKLAICYDGKKPSLFRSFREVDMPAAEEGGAPMRVLIGWR